MYPFLLRTVLTRLDPETAHHLAAVVIRALGVWPLRSIARTMTKPAPELQVQALGLTFSSPFGVAAGFDKNVTLVRGLEGLGFGHVEVGTVTAVPQDGNPRPRLFRLVADRALINRMGFNNHGAAVAARRLRTLRQKSPGIIIGANIGKSRVVEMDAAIADYVTSARLVAPHADYLAVNVSSPNTPGLRGLQAVETLSPLLQAVKAAAGATPLLVKIAPDLESAEIIAIAELAVRLKLDGLIVTNTTISRDGLLADAAMIERIGAGGLSGAPLRERSMEVLKTVRSVVPAGFCVISAGGVQTAADITARLDAGATLVQGYSEFIYSGPCWGRAINRGLSR